MGKRGGRKRTQPRTPCAFCGGTNKKLTAQHIWPDRLKKVLPKSPFRAVTTKDLRSGGLHVEQEQGAVFGLQSRNVCDPCNTKWLSRIEDRAWRCAEPFILNRAARITIDDLHSLALWAGTTAVMAEYAATPPKPHSEDERRFIHRTSSLPPQWTVYLGRERSEEFTSPHGASFGRRYAVRQRMFVPSDDALAASELRSVEFRLLTSHVGWLVLQVFVSNVPSVVDRFRTAWAPRGMLQIFPMTTDQALPSSTMSLRPLGRRRFHDACHAAVDALRGGGFFDTRP